MAWPGGMKSEKERDELRGRFTRFMEVTVRNARIDYLRKLKRQVPTVPLDSIPESQLGYADSRPPDVGFDFDDERLSRTFAELSSVRQRILTLLFVHEMKPSEIAWLLDCPVEYVYKQRSQAIKRLRQMLGGDDK